MYGEETLYRFSKADNTLIKRPSKRRNMYKTHTLTDFFVSTLQFHFFCVPQIVGFDIVGMNEEGSSALTRLRARDPASFAELVVPGLRGRPEHDPVREALSRADPAKLLAAV